MGTHQRSLSRGGYMPRRNWDWTQHPRERVHSNENKKGEIQIKSEIQGHNARHTDGTLIRSLGSRHAHIPLAACSPNTDTTSQRKPTLLSLSQKDLRIVGLAGTIDDALLDFLSLFYTHSLTHFPFTRTVFFTSRPRSTDGAHRFPPARAARTTRDLALRTPNPSLPPAHK